MVRKLPFRSRLVLVVSVPLLVVLGFAGFTIKDKFDALSAEQEYSRLVGPFEALTNLSRALDDEAVLSQWAAHSGEVDTVVMALLRPARATRTNRAAARMARAVGQGRARGPDAAPSRRRPRARIAGDRE